MQRSKVYFTNLRTKVGVSQLDKLEKLIRAAGSGRSILTTKWWPSRSTSGSPAT